MPWRLLYVLLLTVLGAQYACSQQGHFAMPDNRAESIRKLHGRFLHITDIHPDPHYLVNSSVSSSCHRNGPRKEKERAGYWGVPYSECDSPLSLTNLTFDYLQKEWRNKVDFVIWTGDSARHDNDNKLPRSPSEIYESNRQFVRRMQEAFAGVPIVPSLGNNDIWPHNIMTPGPNSITNEYSSHVAHYDPYKHLSEVFQRGAYFSVEVIPDHLAVFSLNTIYWYDSNKAVEGCEYGNQLDPGNLEFDWLEVQLDMYRERGMQVWITGHVPPTPGNYFPECYYRYGELALQYQDTILGHLFGHMNVDHFFWIEPDDLVIPGTSAEHPRLQRQSPLPRKDPSSSRSLSYFMPDGKRAPSSSLDSRTELHEELLKDFRDLPKRSKTDMDDYVVINVAPSIIPAYLPSFRVFQYNVTDWNSPPVGMTVVSEEGRKKKKKKGGHKKEKHAPKRKKGSKRKHGHRRHPKPDCDKEENKNRRECLPLPPRHVDENSPSRTNTLWSPLGYAQYYLPDIGTANETHAPKWRLEYMTYSMDALHPGPNSSESGGSFDYPVPPHLLPKSLRHFNETKTKSKFTPYGMQDLTIPEWIKLARRMAKKDKLFEKFKGYMYMGEEEDDDKRLNDKDSD